MFLLLLVANFCPPLLESLSRFIGRAGGGFAPFSPPPSEGLGEADLFRNFQRFFQCAQFVVHLLKFAFFL